jgi:hypothetical protein
LGHVYDTPDYTHRAGACKGLVIASVSEGIQE